MNFLKLTFILTAMLFAAIGFSQPICGFDDIHHKKMKEDVLYRKAILGNEARIQAYISQQGSGLSRVAAAQYTIPVVVHVVHTGGAVGTIYNPSDAQIMGAIDYLNKVYNGTYPGIEGVGDLQVQFALATRDPNCNATNGIDRIDGSALTNYTSNGVNSSSSITGGITELTLKNFDRWDPAIYYNIWVVNKIDAKDGTSGQFIAGYAYFPGSPAAYDGTIMLATQMISGQKTLPHEIGHALDLYHPFEGSPDKNTCPANADCTADGDKVCDTDPITYNQLANVVDFSCRSGANPCGGVFSNNTEKNYMNYTSCYTLFTAGQKSRILAAMSLPSRASLASSYALGGVYPLSPFVSPVAASCTPVTSATGLSGDAIGIINIAVANKSFNSDGAATDNGYVNRAGKCEYLIPMQKNNTYTFTATLLGYNDEQLRVWIDYNNDGAFSAAEQIYFNGDIPATTDNSFATVSFSFTVPNTTVTGTVLRLRVSDEGSTIYGFTTSTNGCTNPVYGQTEDYPVYMTALLPVQFEYFNGVKKDKDALLNWKTSSEENAKAFQVEKSVDGISFSSIGTVPAADLAKGSVYSFTDRNITAAVNYYRLREVDKDQQSTLSQVVVVKSAQDKTPELKVISNPFTDRLDIVLNGIQDAGSTISMFDITGRKIYSRNFKVADGLPVKIDLSGVGLKPGMYILQVQAGNKLMTEKVIKQ